MSQHENYINLQFALQKHNSRQELQAVIDELKVFFKSGNRDEIYPVFHPKVKYPIYLRRGTSDFLNFIQIFVRAEYSLCFSYIPETIVDLGSYIGLSAIYFCNRFPNSKIICVEPSPDNYDLLKINTRSYNNIHTIKSGIWSHRAKLRIAKQVGGDWGNILEESENDDVDAIQAISIADIVDEFNLKAIDFLKIDIEGSEAQVFSHNTESWFGSVKTVACETHDRFVQGCTEAYEKLFNNGDFEYFQTGEFKTFIKKDISLFDRIKL